MQLYEGVKAANRKKYQESRPAKVGKEFCEVQNKDKLGKSQKFYSHTYHSVTT